jgi:hypothetical protein
MTRRTLVGGVAALGAAIVVSAGLVAQEKSPQEKSPQEQAMMQAWMKYMTPGEHHQKLAARAGEWTYTGTMWHAPGGEPTEFEGTARIKAVLGGRYILETVEGPFMGDQFKGMGVFGYDNLTRTYVGSWIDNLGTGIMSLEGTPSGNGSTIHWTGDGPDLLNGGYKKTRSVEKIVDNDHVISTWYDTAPDGQEYKHLELRYSRQK